MRRTAGAVNDMGTTDRDRDQLQNFYKLDDKAYRSEQPDRRDSSISSRFGIRNVLNLRDTIRTMLRRRNRP